MKTYIVTRAVILKYYDIFGVDPEEWGNGSLDEQFVVDIERELPPEVAREAKEAESYIIDDETGLKYEATLLGHDELGNFHG